MSRLSKVMACALMALSAACGSGSQGGTGAGSSRPSAAQAAQADATAAPAPAADALPAPGPVAAVPAGAIVLATRHEESAFIGAWELEELGIPGMHGQASASGAVTDALVDNGLLRFATADIDDMQAGQIVVVASGKTYVIPLQVMSRMPFAPSSPDHANEDGTPGTPTPALALTGLGPEHAIGTTPIRMRPSDGVKLDAQASSGYAEDERRNQVALEDLWRFDPADNSFTIEGEALAKLRAQLAPGMIDFTVSLQNADYSIARLHMFSAVRADARIDGRVVDADGAAAVQHAGQRVLLVGMNRNIRRIVTVDAAGGFVFRNLLPDTYMMEVIDLRAPGVLNATAAVRPDSTSVSTSIVDDTPRDALQPKAAAPDPSRCTSRQPDGTMVFTAMSLGQDKTVSCPVSFTVPQHTDRLAVEIQVSSLEWPGYTKKKSTYNDTWRFTLTGLPQVQLVDSGSVNQSHATEGLTRQYACVDVSALTADGPLQVGGAASATNVGDSTQPTAVFVRLGLQCSRALAVRNAVVVTPAATGKPMVAPAKVGGNLDGRYLSMGAGRSSPVYGLPLQIAYSPADARIDKVELGLQQGDADPVFADENLLAQAHESIPGRLTFKALVLPSWPAAPRTRDTVRLVARLTGSVAGAGQVSDLWRGSRVTFNRIDTVTPLYLAHDEPALAQRRYGVRDAGGDSWATAGTIDWLGANAYRFDDISAQHVLQTASGGSVMKHAGHSDGQQVDLRYADGRGGFTDAMGGQGEGAAILAALNRAQAGLRNGAAANPDLALMLDWVRDNRRMIGAQAVAPGVRQVFIGKKWIEAALVNGRFPDGVAMPGVGAWTGKPKNVEPEDNHMHHWHVSLDTRPAAQVVALAQR